LADKRLELGLTQVELAKNICTQNVISKVERHNLIPTVPVLLKLCKRLGITMNDVFSDFSNDMKHERQELLSSIEQNLLSNNLSQAQERIEILGESLIEKSDSVKLDLYTAILKILKNEDASFLLDKILTETKADRYNIGTQIVYLLKYRSYQKLNKLEEAAYFIRMVIDATKENIQVPKATIPELLYVCKEISMYYLSQHEYKLAMLYAQRGISLAKQQGIVYFFDYLYFVLARSDGNDKESFKFAQMFALYFQNDVLLKQLDE